MTDYCRVCFNKIPENKEWGDPTRCWNCDDDPDDDYQFHGDGTFDAIIRDEKGQEILRIGGDIPQNDKDIDFLANLAALPLIAAEKAKKKKEEKNKKENK